jgi:hypothetical protein
MRSLYCVLYLLAVSNFTFVQAQDTVSGTGQKENSLSVSGDSPQEGLFFRFRDQALVLDINARIIEQNDAVVWDESHKVTTIPGRPVGIKLVGSNLVAVAQFTPYVRRGVQKSLVAQGQIWLQVPTQAMHYYTSIQTIPLEYGEPIYFFPLGPQKEDASCIEIMLTLYPYDEE